MTNDLVKSKCILALDHQNDQSLPILIDQISGEFKWVKVGMELYFSQGYKILELLHRKGFKIFLDLKLHDIPQTVHNAILSLSHHPFDLITIHLQGGSHMIQMAYEALEKNNHHAKILGVSVLTSFDENSWQKTQSQKTNIKESIQTLVSQDLLSDVYGVVSSGHDISNIKKIAPLKVVVPGIRWSTSHHDQSRVVSPAQALSNGADYLVIGREITAAKNKSLAITSLKEHLHENFHQS